MKQHQLSPAPGTRRAKKRVGRGYAAGQGKTAGRGMKGQKSRSGGSLPLYFEGGQLPLVRRLPHLRGFTNIFRVEYQVVNVENLSRFDPNSEVTPEVLVDARMVRSSQQPVKILGRGEIDRPLTVKAHRFSESARKKIEAAGGTVEELPR
jgi:large subunit ribosomal protein L15